MSDFVIWRVDSTSMSYPPPSLKGPSVQIDPSFDGMLAPTELLRSEGSIQFGLRDEGPEHNDGAIVLMVDKDFIFFIGVSDGYIMFCRGNDLLRLPLKEAGKPGQELQSIVGWTRTHMMLFLGAFASSNGRAVECDTEPYEPPKTLIDWSRKQGLAPVITYENETAFYARVFTMLGSMEGKLENVHDPSCYWDIHYEGNRVVRRTPKREEDLHSIVESVLSDHLFLSSIDVFSEHVTEAGRLDFLLVGSLADGRRLKVCVEFKNTHSPDYMRGLVQQLPTYMVAAGAEVGAYCGLDFQGLWYEGRKVRDRMAEITLAIRSLGNQRRQYPIQYFVYHLGKKVSASHR